MYYRIMDTMESTNEDTTKQLTRRQVYYRNHLEQERQYHRDYYQENLEKVRAKSKLYRQERHDYESEQVECKNCGKTVARHSMRRHVKTKECTTHNLLSCEGCGRKLPPKMAPYHLGLCNALGCLPRGWDKTHPEYKEFRRCVKQLRPFSKEVAQQLKQSFTDVENHFGEPVHKFLWQAVDAFTED